MRNSVYDAAIDAGCTDRQARFLATYVESETLSDAALKLGIHEQSARQMSSRLQRKFQEPHLAAVVARVLHAHLLTN